MDIIHCFLLCILEITCDDLSTITNIGTIHCTKSNLLGSICTLACKSGSNLVGNSNLTCTGNETSTTWDLTPPTCEGKLYT